MEGENSPCIMEELGLQPSSPSLLTFRNEQICSTSTPCDFLYLSIIVVGERELVARCRHTVRNSKYTSAKFHVHRVSRMRKYISLRSSLAGLRVVGGRLALYSCSQLRMLLPCLYCNHQVLAQLLHHFLPYISWIAPARQQCSTFCSFYTPSTIICELSRLNGPIFLMLSPYRNVLCNSLRNSLRRARTFPRRCARSQ